MIKRVLNITLILIVFMLVCNELPGESMKMLKVRELEFKSWFGYKKNAEGNHYYCLLGRGFFTAPRADNTETLIGTWIEEHPDAVVIPVYTFGPIIEDDVNSKQTYCWVVDNSDSLNIFLVRQGCVPCATMQRPKTWEEMSSNERELYNSQADEEVHVHDQAYKNFIDQLKIADIYARKNRLGIYGGE